MRLDLPTLHLDAATIFARHHLILYQNREGVKNAEKAAKAKVRAENPDITEADLEIKFSDNINQCEGRFGAGPHHDAVGIAVMEEMLVNNQDRDEFVSARSG